MSWWSFLAGAVVGVLVIPAVIFVGTYFIKDGDGW